MITSHFLILMVAKSRWLLHKQHLEAEESEIVHSGQSTSQNDNSQRSTGQQSAPKEDPVLTGAKNVVCQLRAKLSLLPEGTLDEGWTSPPLPGGASKRELFTATCLRLEFPGIFSNEEEAACPHVDNCAEIREEPS